MGSGTLGFSTEKLLMLSTGLAQYLVGGFQFNGPEQFFDTLTRNNWYYPSYFFSIFTQFFLLVYWVIWTIPERKIKKTHFAVFVFLSLNFLIATLMNAFEMGTDLQFLIQPMIVIPVAFAFLIDNISVFLKNKTTFLGKCFKLLSYVLIIGFPVLLVSHNVVKFRLPRRGLDSSYSNQIAAIENTFPNYNEIYFVTRGWDEFGTWAISSWGSGFQKRNITVVMLLFDFPNESIDDAKTRLRNEISEKINQGKPVIAGPELIDKDSTELVDLFSGFNQPEKTMALILMVRNEYDLKPVITTEMGTFYEISLKQVKEKT